MTNILEYLNLAFIWSFVLEMVIKLLGFGPKSYFSFGFNCFDCLIVITRYLIFLQNQQSRSVLRKSCSENMQQIYKRTRMPKCDVNKVAQQFYRNQTSAWVHGCSPVNLLHISRTPFPNNTSGWLLLFSAFWIYLVRNGHIGQGWGISRLHTGCVMQLQVCGSWKPPQDGPGGRFYKKFSWNTSDLNFQGAEKLQFWNPNTVLKYQWTHLWTHKNIKEIWLHGMKSTCRTSKTSIKLIHIEGKTNVSKTN